MSEIMTVIGLISTEKVGLTTMHDHVLLGGQFIAKQENFDQTVIDHFGGELPNDPLR